MIFIILLADHFCPTLGASPVNAALASHMWLFMPALRANAVAAGARAGLVTAAAPASPAACATPKAAPATCAGAALIALLSKSIT
jgi:hypothetical protein